MDKRILIVAVILLLLLGGGFLLMRNNQNTAPVTQPETVGNISPTEQPTVEDSATDSADQAEAKEFTVESNGLSFTPKEIRVKQGDKVKVTYKNNDGKHYWTLDDFNAKTKLLDAGQEETVEFTANKLGTFEYYCSVPGHRQSGMKGKFIVE